MQKSSMMEKWKERRRSSAVRRTDDARTKWGKAVSGVKKGIKKSSTAGRRISDPPDPFLSRFTSEERADLADVPVFGFFDVFKAKFWRVVIIDPANSSYYYCSLVIALAILYNIVVVTMRASFYEINAEENQIIWVPMDIFADLVYLNDIFVQSRIGFLEQGLLVRDISRVQKVYFTSIRFVSDLITMIPLDFCYFFVGFNALLRFNKLLKIWRLRDFFRLAETHTNYPNIIRVIIFFMITIVIIHWNACIFFWMSREIGFGADEWVYPAWSGNNYDSFARQYFHCFYWSCLTLTTIGDTPQPHEVISYVYCIVCSLVGVLLFATIFGNIGAMINEMDAQRTEFQHKVDAVKRYMELRGVQGELQARVIKWFDYTWNNKQSIDDRDALKHLPEKLRAELSIHVHLETLRRVTIFQDCEPGLLVELVCQLRLQVFSPGNYVCRKGDIGKEMYIVKRGKLQVVSEDGKTVFVTLSAGAVFGEVSILNIAGNKTGNRRTASVRSLGYSDLFCLSKNDLWEALEEYPEAKKLLSDRGKQILRKDKLIDEEAARREERRRQDLDKKIELIGDAVDDLRLDVRNLMQKIQKRGGSATDGTPVSDEEGEEEVPVDVEAQTENVVEEGDK